MTDGEGFICASNCNWMRAPSLDSHYNSGQATSGEPDNMVSGFDMKDQYPTKTGSEYTPLKN